MSHDDANYINDLEIYRESMALGEEIWGCISTWDSFSKSTLGNQLARSTDSIASNLSEGYGRFHFKENLKFCYYARGSLFETQTWIEKAAKRGLISTERARELYSRLNVLRKRLNAYIRGIKSTAS